MIDEAVNYMNPHTNKFPSRTQRNTTVQGDGLKPQFLAVQGSANMYAAHGGVDTTNLLPKTSAYLLHGSTSKIQTLLQSQYPPQTSSTGSVSPNSSLSASVSPGIYSSPTSFSSSPPTQNVDLSGGYSWNAYTRNQFPYPQYAAPDYYGNMGAMPAGATWFPHQAWPSNSYGFANAFDDIAFQTQMQRRTVRCTCPNCTNEMSGLPPIVGPDERGRKQHICHIPGCERLYGKASHLKTHLRWHTGERPFLCMTCGKRFSRSDELQRHGRTHTNYRPYNCPICSKKFSRSDHLSKHKKTHFKDKKSKKAIAAIVKETTKKQRDSSSPVNTQKSTLPTSDVLGTPPTLKTEPTSTTASPTEVPTGYNPYHTYYQSSALFPQHQQTSEFGLQSQQTASSNYYPTVNMGEATSGPTYASLSHMQYDPLQSMGQSAAGYPIKKTEVYPAYSELISNGMMAASSTAATNYSVSIHHPWSTHTYQN